MTDGGAQTLHSSGESHWVSSSSRRPVQGSTLIQGHVIWSALALYCSLKQGLLALHSACIDVLLTLMQKYRSTLCAIAVLHGFCF